MAISRRKVLALGISYGTGVINHGNDQLAYDHALRELPDNTCYEDLVEAVEDEDAHGALEHARDLRELCGSLSLSSLYVEAAQIVDALEGDNLPSVDEMDALEATYRPIYELTSH